MKQLTIFDFLEEPKTTKVQQNKEKKLDKDLFWCKEQGISIYELIEDKTIEEFAGCTGRSIQYTIELFKSIGVEVKKPMSYARFNRLCINLGIRYREEHRKVKGDFKIVKEFGNSNRLIKFKHSELPVYCLGAKTFDGVKILEVMA